MGHPSNRSKVLSRLVPSRILMWMPMVLGQEGCQGGYSGYVDNPFGTMPYWRLPFRTKASQRIFPSGHRASQEEEYVKV
jgi:hypothetical protein